jgi:hypothetical protein
VSDTQARLDKILRRRSHNPASEADRDKCDVCFLLAELERVTAALAEANESLADMTLEPLQAIGAGRSVLARALAGGARVGQENERSKHDEATG